MAITYVVKHMNTSPIELRDYFIWHLNLCVGLGLSIVGLMEGVSKPAGSCRHI